MVLIRIHIYIYESVCNHHHTLTSRSLRFAGFSCWLVILCFVHDMYFTMISNMVSTFYSGFYGHICVLNIKIHLFCKIVFNHLHYVSLDVAAYHWSLVAERLSHVADLRNAECCFQMLTLCYTVLSCVMLSYDLHARGKPSTMVTARVAS